LFCCVFGSISVIELELRMKFNFDVLYSQRA
jgi:hypothetical protein